MATRPAMFRPRAQLAAAEIDRNRGNSAERGYDAAWRAARDAHLAEHPFCVYCLAGAWGDPPRHTSATLVDHFHPHRGNRAIFWLTALWVASCAPCHSGPKQSLERQGRPALERLGRRLGLPTLAHALRSSQG